MFAFEQVVQRRRRLVAQFVLLSGRVSNFTQTVSQLYHHGIVIQSAGAVPSPQSLKEEHRKGKVSSCVTQLLIDDLGNEVWLRFPRTL